MEISTKSVELGQYPLGCYSQHTGLCRAPSPLVSSWAGSPVFLPLLLLLAVARAASSFLLLVGVVVRAAPGSTVKNHVNFQPFYSRRAAYICTVIGQFSVW